MSKTNDPDYLVISRIQHEGDRHSCEELVSKYESLIFNFCFRFLGNDDDASDCTQDIFIKVFTNIQRFGFRSAFSTWIYKIMINTCRDMARKRKKKNETEMRTDSLDPHTNEILQKNNPDHRPDMLLLRNEINNAFQEALGKLREINKLVLIMRDIEGRSYEEISKLTGIKPGTVRSALSRARYQVANELKVFRNEM